MRRQPCAKAFIDSLPVNGDKRGTLKHRMLSADLRNRIHAKTGHIGGVSHPGGLYRGGRRRDLRLLDPRQRPRRPDQDGLADQMEDKICEILARTTGE